MMSTYEAMRDGVPDGCDARACGTCAHWYGTYVEGASFCEKKLAEYLRYNPDAPQEEIARWTVRNLHGEDEAACPDWSEWR